MKSKWAHSIWNHQRLEHLIMALNWDMQYICKKNQSSASLTFVRGIHRWPVTSPHKGPVTRKMFSFDDVIMKKSKWMVYLRKNIAYLGIIAVNVKGFVLFILLCYKNGSFILLLVTGNPMIYIRRQSRKSGTKRAYKYCAYKCPEKRKCLWHRSFLSINGLHNAVTRERNSR